MSQPNDRSEPFNIGEIERILNSLANEDALKIFIAAKEGIASSTKTIKELGLTQKRYYTRLNELIKAGLIEKRDNIYQLTTIGRVCYTLGEAFDKTLVHRDRLDLADRLRKAKTISLEETNQILQAISSKGIIGSLGVADIIQPVKMINDYESLVSELVSRIIKAKKNIYLASYYTNSQVIEATLEAFERGLDLSFLGGNRTSLIEKLQILRMILSPKIAEFYTMFLDERIKARVSKFPFSFCVIDEKYVIIELPNPLTNDFYMGFSIQNEELSHRLIKTFEALYEEGEEHPLINRFKK